MIDTTTLATVPLYPPARCRTLRALAMQHARKLAKAGQQQLSREFTGFAWYWSASARGLNETAARDKAATRSAAAAGIRAAALARYALLASNAV